jgi:hypothetical protein
MNPKATRHAGGQLKCIDDFADTAMLGLRTAEPSWPNFERLFGHVGSSGKIGLLDDTIKITKS